PTASSLIIFSIHYPSAPDPSTLSLHDALPIWGKPANLVQDSRSVHLPARSAGRGQPDPVLAEPVGPGQIGNQAHGLAGPGQPVADRKSTRLNSSHVKISYAVFCLKKKKNKHKT